MHRRHFLSTLVRFPAVFAFAVPARHAISLDPADLPAEPWRSSPEELARWRRAARRPVMDGAEPLTRSLATAVRAGRRVRFRYHGGSTPGAPRDVSPGLLFTVEGFTGLYLSGYCHTRRAERTFLAARMECDENRGSSARVSTHG